MWVTFLEGYSALAALSLSASTVRDHIPASPLPANTEPSGYNGFKHLTVFPHCYTVNGALFREASDTGGTNNIK